MLLSALLPALLLPALALSAPHQKRSRATYRIIWHDGIRDDIPGHRVSWLGDVGTPVPGYVYGAHEDGNTLGIYASLDEQGDNVRRIRISWDLDLEDVGEVRSMINRGTDQTGKHCLDGTHDPENGAVPVMWSCNSTPQQQWRIHDGLIELDGTGLCLDYKDGAPRPADLKGDEQATIQLWACDEANTNQQWDVEWIGPYSDY